MPATAAAVTTPLVTAAAPARTRTRVRACFFRRRFTLLPPPFPSREVSLSVARRDRRRDRLGAPGGEAHRLRLGPRQRGELRRRRGEAAVEAGLAAHDLSSRNGDRRLRQARERLEVRG